MRISARNQLNGTVKRLTHGAVNTEVVVEVAPGVDVVAIITKTSAQQLGLKEGGVVCAVIKASNVMLAAE